MDFCMLKFVKLLIKVPLPNCPWRIIIILFCLTLYSTITVQDVRIHDLASQTSIQSFYHCYVQDVRIHDLASQTSIQSFYHCYCAGREDP